MFKHAESTCLNIQSISTCLVNKRMHVFLGALKMLDVKLTDVKLTDQFAGHEIVGHEIDGPMCRA